MKVPLVDLSACIQCGVCIDVCPQVFNMNDAGFVAVAELTSYPEQPVNEAIMCCPTDCISWQEA
jgi:ferredoxin